MAQVNVGLRGQEGWHLRLVQDQDPAAALGKPRRRLENRNLAAALFSAASCFAGSFQ
jgi:hypothetical protein